MGLTPWVNAASVTFPDRQVAQPQGAAQHPSTVVEAIIFLQDQAQTTRWTFGIDAMVFTISPACIDIPPGSEATLRYQT